MNSAYLKVILLSTTLAEFISTIHFQKKGAAITAPFLFVNMMMPTLPFFSRSVLTLCLSALLLQSCDTPPTVQQLAGRTMGTTYQVTVPAGKLEATAQAAIDSLLVAINASMSTYLEHSLISQINVATDTTLRFSVDDHFVTVFKKAQEIYQHTDGAFNPALGPLITAWGFDAELPRNLSSVEVDSLLNIVDFDAFVLDPQASHLVKKRQHVALNFSAIAKGYGVDAVALWLEHNGVSSYFVEIGGEIRTAGQNPAGRPWRTGIDRPEAVEGQPRTLQAVIPLRESAMATSGNYRNFYVRDGVKYVHTINPATGYPEISTLLSATVLAEDCMTADAYATAFMVMGLEQAIQFVEQSAALEAYFISSDENGAYQEYFSSGFPEKLDMDTM